MELRRVSLELAKALNEVGFDQEPERVITPVGESNRGALHLTVKDFKGGSDEWYVFQLPTLELVRKWLRDEHKVIVSILPSRVNYREEMEWYKSVARYTKGLGPEHSSYRCEFHGEYDDALEDGIKEACEMIKGRQ